MKLAIPPYLLVFAGLFLLVAGLGGGFWFWAEQQLDKASAAREQARAKLTALDRRAILPVQKNLEALTTKKEEFEALINSAFPQLKASNKAFSTVVMGWRNGTPAEGLTPDNWKRLMNEKRLALDKLAQENRVKVPDNFYYGFSRYRLPNPEAQATAQLGVQLVAIDRLAKILLDSRVESVVGIRRVYFEEPIRPGGPPTGEEALAGAIIEGPLKLYSVYPFELSFRCTTAQLAKVVDGIVTAPEMFVIRFLQIENEVTEIRRRSAIEGQLSNQVLQTKKLFVTVAGEEFLNVRLRVDLILWAEGEPTSQRSAETGQPRNVNP